MNKPSKIYQACVDLKEQGYYADASGTLYDPTGVPVKTYELSPRFPYLRFYYHNGKGKAGIHMYIEIHRYLGYLKFGDDAFISKIVIRHKNDNKLDNSFNNLCLGTTTQKYYDTPEERRRSYVEKAKQIKRLTASEIEEMRRLSKYMKQEDLAKRFGRSVRSVCNWLNVHNGEGKTEKRSLNTTTDLTVLFQE